MRTDETPGEAKPDDVPSKSSLSVPGSGRRTGQEKPVLKHHSLIDKVYNWQNLWTAWRRVRRNKGAHGLDRVTIQAFETNAEMHLRELQRLLMQKRYRPHPVRRVYIPKASDPKQRRPLGIPTVLDRVCQQAVYQVLYPIFAAGFSARSYGFMVGRSAHQAVATVLQDGKEGYKSVVDADIASFFDRLDHEVVMSHVRRRVADGRVLDLIEAFLQAGVMEDGIVSVPNEGSPQGGVISPLLANIVLDAFDKAIEARGWRHVRYADDFVILTQTPQEAAEALQYAQSVLQELKLEVHQTKTRVTTLFNGFEFLGFHFRRHTLGPRQRSIDKFKTDVRRLTRRQQGINIEAVIRKLNPSIRGWSRYFGAGEVQRTFTGLDGWVRMRVRAYRWKRRNHNDNWRFPTEMLTDWGLLSLLQCRPELRFSPRRPKTRRAGQKPPVKGQPNGVAQCGNSAR
ncbi:MAG: group II intron reverse transcriptase/maturase [Candidatus Dormibacteraceae bacterium]